MRTAGVCWAIASVLLLASAALVAQDASAEDPLYTLYGHVRSSDGKPVPDGTLVTARNLDRTDDNTMYFYTYTDGVSAGRYTVTLHAPGMPTSYNSMSYSDGDRIKVSCTLDGETGYSTHVVDVATGSPKQMDFMLKPAASSEDPNDWYTDPMTIGIIAVVAIVAAAAVWYLFVPPKGGR